MKQLALIGSTGTIGVHTLEVLEQVKTGCQVFALAVHSNITLLEKQVKKFKPKFVSIWDEKSAETFSKKSKSLGVKVLQGEEGLITLSNHSKVDTFVFGLSGSKSIFPLLEALKTGKRVCVANKEPLVLAGNLIQKYTKKYGSEILPIDSEHSAIYQCLVGHTPDEVEKILLTSSGGPFFKLPKKDFKGITIERALKHPKWKMGRKITIDSATMMNKGLELIEVKTLFQVNAKQVEIVVHPEAIIHSMVQFVDGSIIAQLGEPDMRFPIQYSLSAPRRFTNKYSRVDFKKLSQMTFYEPSESKFPSIRLAYWAAEDEGTLPAVLNAADEVAVEAFLDKKIRFDEIIKIVEKVMLAHQNKLNPTYRQIMAADEWAREEARSLC